MKNIKLLTLFFLALSLWSCDPLEDEIKEVNDNFAYSADIEYTLVDDDYDISDEACSCSPYGNFSSEDDAKLGIPAILSANFPALEEGSSAKVTYDIYNGSSPDLRGTYTVLTVPSTDYDLFHGEDTFDNFGNPDAEVAEYANWKFPDAKDGDYADITFDYYQGGFHGGVTSRVVYTVAYGWQYAWILPDDVYGNFFFESGIDFSYEDEGKEKIPTYLNYLTANGNDYYSLTTEVGEIIIVQYNFDDRCFEDLNTVEIECPDGPGEPNVPTVVMYLYDGAEWLLYNDAYQVTQNTLSFGHDGTVWVPDNTIKYSLTGADYSAIGAAYSGSNPGGSGSIIQYGNFDISLWSSDQIFEAITNRLLDIPEIIKEDGQKYLVSYATWEPGAGSGSLHVIYDAAQSAFILVE